MHIRTTFYHGLAALLLGIALSACSPLPTQPEASRDPDIARAAQLLATGQYLQASALYQALAGRIGGPEGNDFLLQAIDSAIRGSDLDRADELIQQAGKVRLSQAQSLRLQLLSAELHLARRQGDQALKTLLTLDMEQMPAPLQTRYLRDLADAYRLVGNLLESANTLERLDLRLGGDREARLAVQTEILRALSALSERTLEQLQPPAPDNRGGWMALALLIKQHGADPAVLEPHLKAWRQRFPDHPMLPELLQRSIERLQARVMEVDRIAVLLPQQGRYAAAAQALRDGIMITYYQIPEAQRPILRFYDSSDPANLWPLYSQALAEGAQAIIGPLQKPAVAQLLRAGELDVPVLALNHVTGDTTPPANLYMFSLDPEHEAGLVAERIWQQGLRHPVSLVPETPWGKRLEKAFDDRWEALTGEEVEGRAYPAESADYSQPITQLLHLDLSKARHARVQRWLGQRVEFEPRRRQDIDAFFVAARPQQAQSMRPQLAFFRAADLPMYTTSHAWTGILTQQQLADMRGILLPDIPLLAASGERERLGQLIPGILGPGVRLYAMGMDALKLVPQLQRLQDSPYESIDGQTGNLHMNLANQIVRQLVWLSLDAPVKVLGYSERMDLEPAMDMAIQENPAATDPTAGAADPGTTPAQRD